MAYSRSNSYYCDVCYTRVDGNEQNWEEHLAGTRHHTNAAKLKQQQRQSNNRNTNHRDYDSRYQYEDEYCNICRMDVASGRKNWEEHVSGRRHQRLLRELEDEQQISPSKRHSTQDYRDYKHSDYDSHGTSEYTSRGSHDSTRSGTRNVFDKMGGGNSTTSFTQHKDRESSTVVHCDLCNLDVDGEHNLMLHNQGRRHRANLKAVTPSPAPESTTAPAPAPITATPSQPSTAPASPEAIAITTPEPAGKDLRVLAAKLHVATVAVPPPKVLTEEELIKAAVSGTQRHEPVPLQPTPITEEKPSAPRAEAAAPHSGRVPQAISATDEKKAAAVRPNRGTTPPAQPIVGASPKQTMEIGASGKSVTAGAATAPAPVQDKMSNNVGKTRATAEPTATVPAQVIAQPAVQNNNLAAKPGPPSATANSSAEPYIRTLKLRRATAWVVLNNPKYEYLFSNVDLEISPPNWAATDCTHDTVEITVKSSASLQQVCRAAAELQMLSILCVPRCEGRLLAIPEPKFAWLAS
jgi:hypothetical protein